MALRRRKSRTDRIADMVGTYVKLKAAKTVAKGAGKAAKGTAKVAKRTPVAGRIPILAAAGVAAVLAVRKLRGGDSGAAATA